MNQFDPSQQPLQLGMIPPSPYKSPIRLNANIIGAALLVLNFIPYIMEWLLLQTRPVWISFAEAHTELFSSILDLIFYGIPFLSAIILAVVLLHIPLKVAFPLRAVRFDVLVCSIGIALGALVFGQILTASLSMMLETVVQQAPYVPEQPVPRSILANMLYFVNVAILPAVLEEGLFRGVALQSLRRFGDSFALIISSVLFGIMHGNLVQMPYTTVLGLVIGYFVLYTGSIWPGVIMHFVNNGLAVVLDWMTVNTTAEQDDAIYSGYMRIRLLLGLACLIILRLRLGSLFYVPPSKYPLKENDKYSVFFASAAIIIFLAFSAYLFYKFMQPVALEPAPQPA